LADGGVCAGEGKIEAFLRTVVTAPEEGLFL